MEFEEPELEHKSVSQLKIFEFEQVFVKSKILRVVALDVASELLRTDVGVRRELCLIQLGNQEEGSFLSHVARRDAYRQCAHYL